MKPSPTYEYEPRFNRDPAWTAEMFVEAIYKNLGGTNIAGANERNLEDYRMKVRLSVLVVMALLMGGAASAHHSFAGTYVEGQLMKIEGKVVEFNVRNPHSFILIEVEGQGRDEDEVGR